MRSELFTGFFDGILTIRISGPFTERFFNICKHRRLNVFDIKRKGEGLVVFKTDVKSYREMRTPARRTKSRIKILKKFGAPFMIKRFKKRLPAGIGIIIILLMLGYANSHVMGITVFGNSQISTNEINAALEECGISLGTRTSSINNDTVRNKMMNKLDKLAWIGINAGGSRVYIEIVERLEKDNSAGFKGGPCNLVAAKDGIIKHTEIRNGQTLVKNGSGVMSGDILVSGIEDNTVNGYSFTEARGDVFAETRYKKSREYSSKYKEKCYSGKTKNKYSISIMNFELPLYIKKDSPYNFSDFTEETKEYKTPFEIIPSVFIKKSEHIEFYEVERTRSAEEAVSQGAKELTAELKNELGDSAEIKEYNTYHTLTEHGGVEVTVELICIENIAIQSPIFSSP